MDWKKSLWPEWEIEESIGSGAYGTVYKIKRQDIGGIYYAALKVISFPTSMNEIITMRNDDMTDEQISKYYHRMAVDVCKEFAMMERLKGNTNIVSYEDHKIVQHENGLGWNVMIRMELLTPLHKHLEEHAIDEKEVCKIGIDICNALILCEKENIIHRDIKPGNIFISDFGDYKLGDFNLARRLGVHRDESTPQGTYSYMAPEVYNGKGYDYTIDIYSLGLILYRLLNKGRGPFQPLPPEILTEKISENANWRRLHADVLPRPVDASIHMSQIILKACAYQPDKRYKTAREFQKALMRCETLKSTVEVKEQVSHYIKRAANVLYDFYEDSETLKRSEDVKKKRMKDFFHEAGEL